MVIPGGIVLEPTSLDRAFVPVLRPNYSKMVGSIVFPLCAIYWPFLTSKSQNGVMSRATVSPRP